MTRNPRPRAALAAVLGVALLATVCAPVAGGAASDPDVLERDPYYLSLHEGRGEHNGTVMTLHGGGWRGDYGERADDLMREWIRRITGWGYDAANVGYRGGAESLDDSLAAFDRVRREVGPQERLCIFGGSAGGHLALMIAIRRPSEVDCVIDYLGPPDLQEWGSAPVADAGRQLAVEAFGEERLDDLSPIDNVERIEPPVLVGAAPCDIFIELGAQREFTRALNAAGGEAHLQVIATGDEIDIGHCGASEASFHRFENVARSFLAGNFSDEVVVPEDDDSGIGIAALLAGVVVLGGLGMLAWSLRRRA